MGIDLANDTLFSNTADTCDRASTRDTGTNGPRRNADSWGLGRRQVRCYSTIKCSKAYYFLRKTKTMGFVCYSATQKTDCLHMFSHNGNEMRNATCADTQISTERPYWSFLYCNQTAFRTQRFDTRVYCLYQRMI